MSAAAKKILINCLLAIAVILAIAVRLYNIQMPILERHGFRQTQTAITSWVFLSEGYDLTDYQTPILGPPWQIPLEYPIFQASAALVSELFVSNLDIACRLTNIFFFFLSATFLYYLCARVFERKSLPWYVLFLYLFSPFTIVWSRACIIDYAAVAFALGYTYFLLIWLDKNSRHQYGWLPALILGILAYLTKATTMVGFVIPIGAVILVFLWPYLKRNDPDLITHNAEFLIKSFCCIVLPVLIGFAWIKYSDYIKGISSYTELFTSTNPQMKDWIFGFPQQRMSLDNWELIFGRVFRTVTPYLLSLFPIVSFLNLRKYPPMGRAILVTSLLAIVTQIFVFFNLYYQHDYYLVSLTPFFAIIAGCGLHEILSVRLKGKPIVWFAVVALIIFSCFEGSSYAVDTLRADTNSHEAHRLGVRLQEVTGTDERIIIIGYGLNPSILYYARRKGYMHDQPDRPFPYEMCKRNNFTTLVYRSTSAEDLENLSRLLSGWKHHIKIGALGRFHVYRVSVNIVNECGIDSEEEILDL